MAQDTDLLTLDEAKLWVNLSDSRVGQEDRVEAWVSGISDALDDWAGPIVARTVTEDHYVSGRHSLTLRETPIYSVTSVNEYQSGVATLLTAETPTVAGTYLLDGYIVRRQEQWNPSSFNGHVRVVFQAGRYASTEDVGGKYKTAAGMALQRLWSQYAPAWARGGSAFADGEDATFYFRAIAPVAGEMGIPRRIRPLVA